MHSDVYKIHEHDRLIHANQLGMSLEQFDRLLESANKAYHVMYDLGPFYGREDIFEPTFRITAEPVYFSSVIKKKLEKFGNNLLFLGKALAHLPEEQKLKLGSNLDFRVPPTWRVDMILTDSGEIKVNEIEGVDSANALMMAEQLAYGLQTLKQSTAAQLIESLKVMFPKPPNEMMQIAILRSGVRTNPHTTNHRRFVSFIHELSKEAITVKILDEEDLVTRIVRPDWREFDGVINETSLNLLELQKLGIRREQVVSMGNYNALGNKGVFALIFDKTLEEFWINNLGIERLRELQDILIPSYFIENEDELEKAHDEDNVVKVSWADKNTTLINRSRGVLMPEGDEEHSSEERKQVLKEFLHEGVTIIGQEFVKPAKIHAYLRKKGTSLEEVLWYNRVCIKYVVEGNPEAEDTSLVSMTAVGVTLGPDVIPAGRKCAFTAGAFLK